MARGSEASLSHPQPLFALLESSNEKCADLVTRLPLPRPCLGARVRAPQ
jgi:hypothetical protein